MNMYIISGMPHSATRLAYNLLSGTGEFNLPSSKYLNSVKEMPMLHAYLTQATLNTPISKDLDLSESDISYIMKSYISLCDDVEDILIKMPFYPIVYSRMFVLAAKKLGYKVNFIVVDRDLENIKESFLNRNEDLKYSQPLSLLSQINKVPVSKRMGLLKESRFIKVLDEQYNVFMSALNCLQNENECTVVSVNNLNLLQDLCKGEIDFESVNSNRLKKNKKEFFYGFLKKLERQLLIYKYRKY